MAAEFLDLPTTDKGSVITFHSDWMKPLDTNTSSSRSSPVIGSCFTPMPTQRAVITTVSYSAKTATHARSADTTVIDSLAAGKS